MKRSVCNVKEEFEELSDRLMHEDKFRPDLTGYGERKTASNEAAGQILSITAIRDVSDALIIFLSDRQK